MEQLAQAVLNGEGKKLIGRETNQTDIQAFIDNVPTYMVRMFYMFKDLVIYNLYILTEQNS